MEHHGRGAGGGSAAQGRPGGGRSSGPSCVETPQARGDRFLRECPHAAWNIRARPAAGRRHSARIPRAHRRRTGNRQVHAEPSDSAVLQGCPDPLCERRGERKAGQDARGKAGRRRLLVLHTLRDEDGGRPLRSRGHASGTDDSRFRADHVHGQHRICARVRQPGEGGGCPAAALRQGKRNPRNPDRAYHQGGVYSRPEDS